MILAAFVVVLLGLLAILQIALACGAPLGRFAWGGQQTVLSGRQRTGSVVAVLLYGIFAVILLARAGALGWMPSLVSGVGVWVVFGVFALGVLANAASKSRSERAVMVPTNAVLALATALVAVG